jgi:hypothetical protein
MSVGRRRRRRDGRTARKITLLAAAVTASLITGACGPADGEPRDVPLEALVAEQRSFDGARVRTRGAVRAFGDDSAIHQVIQDRRSNRVQLLPDAVARRYVGHMVIVVGTFGFDEESGRFIRVEAIRRVDRQA